MAHFLVGFTKSLLIFSIILFSLHTLIDQFIIGDIKLFYPPWSIHLFLFITTLLIVGFVVYVKNSFADKAGFAFLGGSFMKMILSLFFLIPLIKNKEEFNIINVLVFFAPYFIYLAFETFIILKLINKKSP